MGVIGVVTLLAALALWLAPAQASESGGQYARTPNGEGFRVCGGAAEVIVNSTGGELHYDISLGNCEMRGLSFTRNGSLFQWTGEMPCGNVVFKEATFFKYNTSMSNWRGQELRNGWDYLEVGADANHCLYHAKLSLSILDWLVPVAILAGVAFCVGCCCLSARIRKGSNPRPPPGASADWPFDGPQAVNG